MKLPAGKKSPVVRHTRFRALYVHEADAERFFRLCGEDRRTKLWAAFAELMNHWADSYNLDRDTFEPLAR